MEALAAQPAPGLPPLPPAQQQQQAVHSMPGSVAAQKRAHAAGVGQTTPTGEGGTPAAGEEPKKASCTHSRCPCRVPQLIAQVAMQAAAEHPCFAPIKV